MKQRRRWCRFSLRALLVLLAAISVPLAWVSLEIRRASRQRQAEEAVETLGAKVDPDRDSIEVDGQAVKIERKIYLALNKPRGYISDRDETGGQRAHDHGQRHPEGGAHRGGAAAEERRRQEVGIAR